MTATTKTRPAARPSSIRVLPHLVAGPKEVPAARLSNEDNSTVLYPKDPRTGKSFKVTLIRRSCTLTREGIPGATVFHVVRNAGRWSYRIEYRHGTRRMNVEKFRREAERMGAGSALSFLLANA